MYNAPLYHELVRLSAREMRRMHTPGHKGRAHESAFDSVFAIDYTETPATGNLYDGDGAIAQAEALCAAYYGMQHCFFLTCGATQGVKAAMAALCAPGGSVVLDRNCHQSALDACVLLDLRPAYVLPAPVPGFGITGSLDPALLGRAIDECGAKAAVVTSPTYYGVALDIAALAEAAHERGAKLIVDSAHGSHLRACGLPDAAYAGADAVVFSAHKTLGALTQGAYLLTRGLSDAQNAHMRRMTAMFGTSSPSYPMMASLDLARAMLEQDADAYCRSAALCRAAAERINRNTRFRVLASDDPCRLTVCTAAGGLRGDDAAELVRRSGIEPEMSDALNVVFIITHADDERDISAIAAAFEHISAHTPPAPPFTIAPCPVLPVAPLTPRQAFFAPSEWRPLVQCAGHVAAACVSPYPPGVPVLAPGELLDNFFIEKLAERGYTKHSKVLTIVQTGR